MSTSRYSPTPSIHSITELIAYLSGLEGEEQSKALNRIDLEKLWHELMYKLDRSEHFQTAPFKALIQLYAEVPLNLRYQFLNTTYKLYNFNRHINTIDDLAKIIGPSVSGASASGHSNVEMIKSLVGIEKIHSLITDANILNSALNLLVHPADIPKFILEIVGKSHFRKIAYKCQSFEYLYHVSTEQMRQLIPAIYTKDEMKQMVANFLGYNNNALVVLMEHLPPSWQLDVIDVSHFHNYQTDWHRFLRLLQNTHPDNRLTLLNSFGDEWINTHLRPELDKFLQYYFPPDVLSDLLDRLNGKKSRTNRIEEILATPYTAKDVTPEELEEIQHYIDQRLNTTNTTEVLSEIEPSPNRYQLFPHTNAAQGRNATLYLGNQQTSMTADRMSEVKIADVIGALIIVPLLLVLVSWIHEAYKRGRDNHFQLPYHNKYRNGRGD